MSFWKKYKIISSKIKKKIDLIKWEIGKLIRKNILRICIENIDNILKIWKIWIWYKRLFKIEVNLN